MLTTQLTTVTAAQAKADVFVFFLEQGAAYPAAFHDFVQKYVPLFDQLVQKHSFKAANQELLVVPFVKEGQVATLLCVGLGKKKASQKVIDVEYYRRALGKAVKRAIALEHKPTLHCVLPDGALFGVTFDYLVQHTTTIAHMAALRFDLFKTTDREGVERCANVIIQVDEAQKAAAELAMQKGAIIADAVNKARLWGDMPPSDLPPKVLAQHAHDIAQKHNLKIQIFGEQQVRSMGMGGLSGVSRGSEQDCQFVIMEYDCGNASAPRVAFVGKGITFDSGGLSIKPAANMETMKDDMAGAGAVIATMGALAQLKPAINIVALTPITENLISGHAMKPGDVVTFYNGKTAEVKNTDAEGRLVLADALSYVMKHYDIDAIVDIATLTGACSAALGPCYTGLMSQHDSMIERLEQAAATSGDRVWELPLHDDYKVAIHSEVADMSNIGSSRYMAGAITAAHFLKHFVGDVPWAHLDIAGTAFNVPDISYHNAGATGVGVRLLIDLALQWPNKK